MIRGSKYTEEISYRRQQLDGKKFDTLLYMFPMVLSLQTGDNNALFLLAVYSLMFVRYIVYFNLLV